MSFRSDCPLADPWGPALSSPRCRAVGGHRDMNVPLPGRIDGTCASHCDHTTTLRHHGTPRVGRRPANRVPPRIQRHGAARHEDFEIRFAGTPDHAAFRVLLRDKCAGLLADLVQALRRVVRTHVLDARRKAWRCRQQQPEGQCVSTVNHGAWKVGPRAFSRGSPAGSGARRAKATCMCCRGLARGAREQPISRAYASARRDWTHRRMAACC